MRYYTLVLILLLLAISVNAQQVLRLSGVVKTTAGGALPYANIRLVNESDTTKFYGVSTDNEGKFSMTASPGIYSLEISYIGYMKQTASVQLDKDVTLPEIILAEDNQMMDEVVVTAKNITYHATGYVAEISANPFYRNYDLDQILILTPGTNVVRDEISLYGKRVSKVYVDGREVRMQGTDLMQYLRNFNGRNVRRMELLATGGHSSNHNSDIHYNTTNINTRWRTGKWSTYLIGSFGKGKSSSSNNVENIFHNSGNRLLTEDSSTGKTPGNISSTVGLGYDIDDCNLITVEGIFRSRRNSSRIFTDTRQWESDATGFEQTTSGFSNNNNNAKIYNLSLNYTYLFNEKSSLVFTADRVQNDGEKN